ncbi:MAG: thiamine pyrophosphate-binding protein [Nitrospirota bacterium]
MNIKVSEFIVKYLERLGTEYVFGIPGAHILPVYDAMYDTKINPVLTKHEQGASFMAGGYAQQSGKIGVCIATAGPGATNLVTGLAHAFMDRLPVLAITGETPTYSFGKGALQESSGQGHSINQNYIFRGITKYHTIVQRTDYFFKIFKDITSILLSRNPGPVLLSFPYNVLKETVDGSILDSIHMSGSPPQEGEDTLPSPEILSMIRTSSYPVMIAGYGSILSRAEDLIADFCRKTAIPVATTLKARGILPETSDLSLGVLGITSNELAYRYITEKADLLIFAGASFGERTSYNWDQNLISGKKIIQIDNNEKQLNKVFHADIALKCDVRVFFDNILKVDPYYLIPKDSQDIKIYKSTYANHDVKDNEFLLINHFLQKLNSHFDCRASIFDDNIIYMQRFCHISKSRSYFPNSGLSSLGHAVPAAIGAKLSTAKPVIAIVGDGGFQMCCMEIMTAVNYNIPVSIVLLNNSGLGLVRKNQFYNYNGRFIASEFINPDYKKLAESFDINYFRVVSTSDADDAFKCIDFKNKINLIELILDKDEFPKYSSGR